MTRADDTTSVLVSGSEETTGKTAVGLAIGQLGRDRDRRVGYMKPRGTRLQSTVGKTLDRDPMLASELFDLEIDLEDLEPIVYSPTFIEAVLSGREDAAALHERVLEAYRQCADGRDLMIVEGASGTSLGEIIDLTDADLASLLDAEVIVVAGFEDVRDVDVVLSMARDMGDHLGGVLFNGIPSPVSQRLESDVVPFLEGQGVPVLGVLPRIRELAGVRVGDLASELGARLLTDAPTDAYVERFLIGAMGGESALRHFRRTHDAVVITGGDRADILSVALEVPGVEGLVLTGGLRPSGAVLGKAQERGVPVMVVQTDTVTTIERVEGIIRSGRTRDAATVERMRELLLEHADVDALLGTEASAADEGS